MDVMYDAILGKMREGDEDSGGGGGQYVKQMVYVTDSDSQPVLNLTGGTHYTYTAPVTNFQFVSVEDSHDESVVVFTASTASILVNIPTSVSVVGNPSFEAGKSYIISVRDNFLVAAEYTPGVSA